MFDRIGKQLSNILDLRLGVLKDMQKFNETKKSLERILINIEGYI